jgi:ATP-binding cassette subfamily B protein
MSFLLNLRQMMVVFRMFKKEIVLSQICILVMAAFMLAIPSEISLLINDGISAGNLETVVYNALRIILYAFIAGIFTMLNLFFATRIAEGVGNALRTEVYDKIQHFSFHNLDRFPPGELMVRLTNDITQINIATQFSIRFLLLAPFMIVVALILVALNSPGLIWIFGIAIPASAIVFGGTALVLQKEYRERQKKLGRLNTVLQEAFAGIRVVKAFVRQDFEARRFDAANTELKTVSVKPLYTVAFIVPGMFFILGITYAAATWFGGTDILNGTMAVGELVAFSQYFMIVLGQIWLLSLVIPQIFAAEASAGRLAEMNNTQPAIQDSPSAIAINPAAVKGRVAFEDVSFSYDGAGGTMAVSGISLVAEPGETVAFLGATGSGKSTLVNLVPRFYDVTGGRITLDGVDVRMISQNSLHATVIPALQASILFSGTVRENIAFGKPDASMDEVVAAAEASDANGFISAIPEMYDARVARQGANFSGGQRQRISIARAITPKPRVIILDDSTSAVDVATEARIQQAMSSILKGTTTLVVAQRISTVLNADKIVLLDGGKIAVMGSHKELIGTSPLYREIFDSQLGRVGKEGTP